MFELFPRRVAAAWSAWIDRQHRAAAYAGRHRAPEPAPELSCLALPAGPRHAATAPAEARP